MAWEENPRICLHMQLIAILSRTGVCAYVGWKFYLELAHTPATTIHRNINSSKKRVILTESKLA